MATKQLMESTSHMKMGQTVISVDAYVDLNRVDHNFLEVIQSLCLKVCGPSFNGKYLLKNESSAIYDLFSAHSV